MREPSGVQGTIKPQSNVKIDMVMANGIQKARGPQLDQTNMGNRVIDHLARRGSVTLLYWPRT